MIRFGFDGSTAKCTTGIAGRSPRMLHVLPPSLETNTPTSVPTTSLPATLITASAGASGRSPEMSVNVCPASCETYRCPVPILLVSSPSAPGGIQCDEYPPSVAYTVLPVGPVESIDTDVMNRCGSPFAAAMCQPFELLNCGASDPPTVLAMPLLNGALART